VVQEQEIEITILPKSPQLPFPMVTKTLQLPKTSKTMQPPWMDESTVRIDSCPATGVQDSEIMRAIYEAAERTSTKTTWRSRTRSRDAYYKYGLHC
jgi:hypothetical protein